VTPEILVVENNFDRRMIINTAFERSGGPALKIDYLSCAEASRLCYDYHSYTLAIVDFGPDPQAAAEVARLIKSVSPGIALVILTPSDDFQVPAELAGMGPEGVAVSDGAGVASLPGMVLDLVEEALARAREKTETDDLKRRNRDLREITSALARQSVHLLHLRNELASEKIKLETVINGMGDGMVFFGVDGAVELINPVAAKLLSTACGGQKLTREKFIEGLESKPQKPGGAGAYTSYEARLGARTFLVRMAEVAGPEAAAAGSLALITDITREKEYERLKDDFTSMISHELRTPLTSIQAATHNLLRGNLGGVNSDQRRFIEVIARNVERQQALIDDLLDLSKLETGQMKLKIVRADLSLVILQAVEQYSLAFRDKQIEVVTDIDQATGPAAADPHLMAQVISNLLSNALKFTDHGGKVTVGYGPRTRNGGRYCGVTVEDSGIGIDADQIDRVFDKYFQADSSLRRRYPGTGLGLAICREIINAHKGFIWAESAPGEGSRFHALIPMAGEA